jgi:DNA topoisomerase-1
MNNIERLQTKGILRKGSAKRGFSYKHANGERVSKDDLARIESLKLPPAWKEVAISSAASASLQAVGKDAAGRWQYIYHDNHVRHRERKKFVRVIQFGESLPAMRKTVAQHLRLNGLPRERVMASIVRILSTSFIRPGSQVYANENGSYGIATLRPKHVSVKRDVVVFDFPGKSGVSQHREVRDRQVARVVRDLLKHPAHEIFKYEDEEGRAVDVKRRHINQYIKEIMGHRFSAKDFRTWAGSLVCACALARIAAQDGELKIGPKRKVVLAVNETAEALGNTAAVCRSAYISPEILTAFEKGNVINRHFDTVDKLIGYRGVKLHAAERALLRFLKSQK